MDTGGQAAAAVGARTGQQLLPSQAGRPEVSRDREAAPVAAEQAQGAGRALCVDRDAVTILAELLTQQAGSQLPGPGPEAVGLGGEWGACREPGLVPQKGMR